MLNYSVPSLQTSKQIHLTTNIYRDEMPKKKATDVPSATRSKPVDGGRAASSNQESGGGSGKVSHESDLDRYILHSMVHSILRSEKLCYSTVTR